MSKNQSENKFKVDLWKWQKDDIARIEGFFEPPSNKDKDNSNDKNFNYYVYALCDGNVPFYIGKGIGARCFNHEGELEYKLNEYLNEYPDKNEDEIKIFRENLQKELNAKLEKIKLTKERKTFNIAVIKFGLTEHESFMCESALINMLGLCGIELTNIDNGHGSQKEKENGEKVKARFIDDFLNECCPRQVALQEIKDSLESPAFPFEKSVDDVAFISFNTCYPLCKTDIDIWDAVRGGWRREASKGKSVKYIFAMHNNIIKGIYKVKPEGEKDSDFQKIDSVTCNLKEIAGSNIHEFKTKGNIEMIGQILKIFEENPELREKTAKKVKKEEIFKKIKEKMPAERFEGKDGLKISELDRGFWNCNYDDFINDPHLLTLREKFLNCQVSKEELIIPQYSVFLLYRDKETIKKEKTEDEK